MQQPRTAAALHPFRPPARISTLQKLTQPPCTAATLKPFCPAALSHPRSLHAAPTPALQESLKDARLANAGMDDNQLAAGRQMARLKHALEEAHAALREAQAALDKVGIWWWGGVDRWRGGRGAWGVGDVEGGVDWWRGRVGG